MPVISALRRLRQEHPEIEASLGTITESCLKNKYVEIEKKSGSAILSSLTINEKSQSTQGLPAIPQGWVVGQILCLLDTVLKLKSAPLISHLK